MEFIDTSSILTYNLRSDNSNTSPTIEADQSLTHNTGHSNSVYSSSSPIPTHSHPRNSATNQNTLNNDTSVNLITGLRARTPFSTPPSSPVSPSLMARPFINNVDSDNEIITESISQPTTTIETTISANSIIPTTNPDYTSLASIQQHNYPLSLPTIKAILHPQQCPFPFDSSDFECSLCFRLFCKPVSTLCGHTYCK